MVVPARSIMRFRSVDLPIATSMTMPFLEIDDEVAIGIIDAGPRNPVLFSVMQPLCKAFNCSTLEELSEKVSTNLGEPVLLETLLRLIYSDDASSDMAAQLQRELALDLSLCLVNSRSSSTSESSDVLTRHSRLRPISPTQLHSTLAAVARENSPPRLHSKSVPSMRPLIEIVSETGIESLETRFEGTKAKELMQEEATAAVTNCVSAAALPADIMNGETRRSSGEGYEAHSVGERPSRVSMARSIDCAEDDSRIQKVAKSEENSGKALSPDDFVAETMCGDGMDLAWELSGEHEDREVEESEPQRLLQEVLLADTDIDEQHQHKADASVRGTPPVALPKCESREPRPFTSLSKDVAPVSQSTGGPVALLSASCSCSSPGSPKLSVYGEAHSVPTTPSTSWSPETPLLDCSQAGGDRVGGSMEDLSCINSGAKPRSNSFASASSLSNAGETTIFKKLFPKTVANRRSRMVDLPPIPSGSLLPRPALVPTTARNVIAGAFRSSLVQIRSVVEPRACSVGEPPACTFAVTNFPRNPKDLCTHQSRIDEYEVVSMAKRLSLEEIRVHSSLTDCLKTENELLQKLAIGGERDSEDTASIEGMLAVNASVRSMADVVNDLVTEMTPTPPASRRSASGSSEQGSTEFVGAAKKRDTSAAIVRFVVSKVNRLHRDSVRVIRAYPPRGLITISKPTPSESAPQREETVFEIHKRDYQSCTIVRRMKYCLMIRFMCEGSRKRHQYRFESENEVGQFYQYLQDYMET